MGFGARGLLAGVATLLVTAGCERLEGREQEVRNWPVQPEITLGHGEEEPAGPAAPTTGPLDVQQLPEPLRAEERIAGEAAQRTRLVRGQVSALSEDELLVAARTGEDVRMRLTPGTAVLVDGRPATADALREGSQVRATFGHVEGQPVALLVEVERLPDTDAPLQPAPLYQLPEPQLEETQQLPMEE